MMHCVKGFDGKAGSRDNNQHYRLLADGTVLDQENGKIKGYIEGEKLDEIFYIRNSYGRQKAIREYLGLEK